jgi:phosphatidate cytidylyltransferase
VGGFFIAILTGVFVSLHLPLFNWVFALFLVTFTIKAYSEYASLATIKGTYVAIKTASLCIITYTLGLLVFPNYSLLPSLVTIFTLIALFIRYGMSDHSPITGTAVTLFGLVYVAWPLSCIYNLAYILPPQGIDQGRWLILYTLCTTKVVDMGGYFIGRTMGKHLLAPKISPKKTIEGAIGGIIAAALVSYLFYSIDKISLHPYLNLTPLKAAVWGVIIAILAQGGDLAESLLKRDAGVKDSHRLPGLGGLLDMVDSLLFTIPCVWSFWQF